MVRVTIDGPAGVGKTSVGREVAESFGLLFVQSGRLYRGIAYGKLQSKDYRTLTLKPGTGCVPELLLNGEGIPEDLDTEEVGEEASKLAQRAEIRDLVNDRIHDIAQTRDVLVEGRDIGTVVLPEADVKVFLTASARERARRRKKQLDLDRPLGKIEEGIKRRDRRDEEREVAPLKPAEEATIIDTTELSEREVIEQVSELVERFLSDETD
ncbi:MAG: (d)CMP kinase [Candidatus Acetothermia bacterium]